MMRIRICGSLPQVYASGSGSCSSSVAFKIRQNNFISLSLFAYYLITVGTFTSVFKDDKLLRSYKTVEIKGFQNFLLVDKRGRIRTNNYESGSGRPKNLMVPDPGYRLEVLEVYKIVTFRYCSIG
jgi:hypothetical protein